MWLDERLSGYLCLEFCVSGCVCSDSRALSCTGLQATPLDRILPRKQNSKGKGFNLPSALGSVISNSLLETLQTQSIYSPFILIFPPRNVSFFIFGKSSFFTPSHGFRHYQNVINGLDQGLFEPLLTTSNEFCTFPWWLCTLKRYQHVLMSPMVD